MEKEFTQEEMEVMMEKVREDEKSQIKEILKIFKDDSIYTGRIVKFEIKNRLGVGKKWE